MTRPLSDFLAEFSPAASAASSMQENRFDDDFPPMGLDEPGAEEDVVDVASQEALAEQRRVVQSECDDRLQSLEHQHAAAIDAARAHWTASEARILAASLKEGFEALEIRLADSLASVITPFLEAAVRVKTTAELRHALSELLAGGQGGLIEVRGTADVLEDLRMQTAELQGVVFTPSDQPEVTIEVADTTIRSQMQAWTTRLQGALGIAA